MHDTPKTRKRACFFCEAAWAGISQALSLSEREVEIFQRLILGESEREVAAALATSPRTVRTHLERLRRKLGLHNRTELIVRIFDAHFDWLVQARIPSGCRLKGRLTGVRNAAGTNGVHDTHCYFCQPAWEAISQRLDFTDQESKIVRHVTLDEGDRKAGKALGLSVSTMRTYLARVYARLGVHSRMALMKLLCREHQNWLYGKDPPEGCSINIHLTGID